MHWLFMGDGGSESAAPWVGTPAKNVRVPVDAGRNLAYSARDSPMILEIVQYGHPVLRQRCRKVVEVDEELVQLVGDMLDTMVEAHGVGLAAPQVGVPIRLAVVDVAHDPECISYLRVNGVAVELESIMPLVFINPEVEFGQPKEFGVEGCLSIREIRAEVRRPIDVKATLPQLDGSVLVVETDGLLARALQHEIDHLNGVLFVDRLPAVAKVAMRRRLKLLAEETAGD